MKERIRGISQINPLPIEQLEYDLLDKEFLVLHCFPLASVLLHTTAKMCLAILRKLPCSSSIFLTTLYLFVKWYLLFWCLTVTVFWKQRSVCLSYAQ